MLLIYLMLLTLYWKSIDEIFYLFSPYPKRRPRQKYHQAQSFTFLMADLYQNINRNIYLISDNWIQQQRRKTWCNSITYTYFNLNEICQKMSLKQRASSFDTCQDQVQSSNFRSSDRQIFRSSGIPSRNVGILVELYREYILCRRYPQSPHSATSNSTVLGFSKLAQICSILHFKIYFALQKSGIQYDFFLPHQNILPTRR